jgi:hypothetical protein
MMAPTTIAVMIPVMVMRVSRFMSMSAGDYPRVMNGPHW